MKTVQTCLPCIMGLMETTLSISDVDRDRQQTILEELGRELSTADMTYPPARNAGLIYQKILQETGQKDIFLTHKQNSIQEALKLYPRLKKLAEDARDTLDAAFRISALGNILDVANPNTYSLEKEIASLLEVKIWGESLEIFRTRLSNAGSLLILADNAGEAVFDRVLIESLDVPVIYAVKSGPAFDDALLEDAKKTGIDHVAQVIESGTSFPGTYLPSCSPEFQKVFTESPLILAKGQANFETLTDAARDLFFLLKIKCDVVSDFIGYPVGSLTLRYKS